MEGGCAVQECAGRIPALLHAAPRGEPAGFAGPRPVSPVMGKAGGEWSAQKPSAPRVPSPGQEERQRDGQSSGRAGVEGGPAWRPAARWREDWRSPGRAA